MFHRLALALLLLLPQAAFPACGLLCTCTVLLGGAVNFGTSFSPQQVGNTDSSGSFTLQCTAVLGGVSADYSIALSAGNGTYASRKMTNGISQLAYNLYTTADRTVVWGDGTSGTAVVTGTLPIIIVGTASQVLNVYGRITGPQANLTPGSYSDTITITVTY